MGINNFQKNFVDNIIAISTQKKGTIIIISDELADDRYSKIIKGKIKIANNGLNQNENYYRDYILTQLSLTDGAVLINKNYEIYGFGAILKISNETKCENENYGGSRSYVAERFAFDNPEALVIKISEDGPICVRHNRECVIEI